jgi:hypothetical protein
MNTYYLAIKGYEPIQVTLKTNLTQSTIDSYIQIYGLDFIGFYETYQDAKQALRVDYYLFGNDRFNKIDIINHLERCYNINYNFEL